MGISFLKGFLKEDTMAHTTDQVIVCDVLIIEWLSQNQGDKSLGLHWT
jgi:hypothetical protein